MFKEKCYDVVEFEPIEILYDNKWLTDEEFSWQSLNGVHPQTVK